MRRIIILLVAMAMIMAACTNRSSDDETSDPDATTVSSETSGTTSGEGPAGLFAASLQTFDSCDAFLDHVKAEAIERVGPYGLEGDPYFGGPVPFAIEQESAALDDGGDFDAAATTIAGSPAAAPVAGVDYSTTNVQEAGVDEPDIVKTDGTRIIAAAQGTIHYLDVTEEGPVLRSSLPLQWGWNQEILLSGDTALVMFTMSRYDVSPRIASGSIAPGYGGDEISVFVELDISNPDEMTVERTLYVDGRYVSARMIDGTARLVFASRPVGLEFVYPAGEGLRGQERATEVNREVIEESTIDNWLPYYILESGDGEVIDEGTFLECEDAYYPEEFAGFTMVSILTVDLDEGLDPAGSVGVLAGGDTVYASMENLYVASQRWIPWEELDEASIRREAESVVTSIHKFNISEPETTYEASGSLQGFLLNQFAMSEYEGHLRVASTDIPNWAWWGSDRVSESSVTVFAQEGGELVETGSVGGLGEGEQIFAVRFIGDVGYVVTFRQVDPLYTIDLSDPGNPVAVGELKIPGFSSYLHPIEEDVLLGIGQDATEEGITQGFQVSVFDVSDLENPVRLHQWTAPTGENGSSYSEAEYDHRAFLYWPPTGMTVLPVNSWSWDEEADTEDFFAGAYVLEANRDGIEEIGTISQQPEDNKDDYHYWGAQIRRSIVIGESLYTISEVGVMASDMATLEDQGIAWFDGSFGPPIPEPLEEDAPATTITEEEAADDVTDSSLPVEEGDVTDTTAP